MTKPESQRCVASIMYCNKCELKFIAEPPLASIQDVVIHKKVRSHHGLDSGNNSSDDTSTANALMGNISAICIGIQQKDTIVLMHMYWIIKCISRYKFNGGEFMIGLRHFVTELIWMLIKNFIPSYNNHIYVWKSKVQTMRR